MLGDKLVEIALQWQSKYGVAPQITTVISEYDAAMLVGMSESDYSDYMQDKTAVSKGADFVFNHQRYQIKANRPSGKPGSKVTKVPKATNYLWDKLIWILYDQHYVMQEAWEWDVENYKLEFDDKSRISPNDYRKGKCLFTKIEDKVQKATTGNIWIYIERMHFIFNASSLFYLYDLTKSYFTCSYNIFSSSTIISYEGILGDSNVP